LYPQFFDSKQKSVIQALLADQKIHFIHLVRSNFLDVLISLKRATLSREWWRMDPNYMNALQRIGLYFKPNDAEVSVPRPEAFIIEPGEAEAFFKSSEQNITHINQTLIGHPVLHIYYDELIENASECPTQIIHFLGARPLTLTSRNIAHTKFPKRELLTNYDALKKHFSGSKWGVYFTE
jgi:hypothetical protein